MARKKKPESVTIEGFTWLRENPASDPDRERWRVDVPTIIVFVTNYAGAPQGRYFTGWRVVAGGPSAEEYPDRDAAIAGAREVIRNMVIDRITKTQQVIDGTNKAMAVLREAGIEIGSKTR